MKITNNSNRKQFSQKSYFLASEFFLTNKQMIFLKIEKIKVNRNEKKTQ